MHMLLPIRLLLWHLALYQVVCVYGPYPVEMRRCSFISEEKAPEVNEAVNEDVEKNIWRHPTVGFSRAHACPLQASTPPAMHGTSEARMYRDVSCCWTCIHVYTSVRESWLASPELTGREAAAAFYMQLTTCLTISSYVLVLSRTYLTSPLW